MYARVSNFKTDPARRDEIQAVIEGEVHPMIEALPGLVSLVSAAHDDGSGITVAVYESEEAANAVTDQVSVIWSKMAHFLTEPPSVSGYSVMVHIHKG